MVAADHTPFSREALAALGPEALLDLELSLAPGAAFLSSEWPLGDLWGCRDKPDEEIAVEVFGRPTKLVIFRDGLTVRWRELASEEADFLAACERGTTLATLADCGTFGPPAVAAGRLVSLFVPMIESAIIWFLPPETPPGASHFHKERLP